MKKLPKNSHFYSSFIKNNRFLNFEGIKSEVIKADAGKDAMKESIENEDESQDKDEIANRRYEDVKKIYDKANESPRLKEKVRALIIQSITQTEEGSEEIEMKDSDEDEERGLDDFEFGGYLIALEERVNSILAIDQIPEQLDSSNVDLAIKAIFDNFREESDNSDLNDTRDKIISFYNPDNPATEKNKGVLVAYLSSISSYSNTSIDSVIKFLYGNDASLEKIVSDEIFVLSGKGHAKVDIFDASKYPESIKKIKEVVKLFNNLLSEKYLSFEITDSDDPYELTIDFISIAALEKFTPNEIAEIIFHECSHAYESEIFEAEEDFKKGMNDLHKEMIPDELRLKIKELHKNHTIEKRIELEASPLYKKSLISIFDESTYKERLGGHPYDNVRELFASTASIIKYYPDQLIQNINKLNENDKKTATEVVKMVAQKYQGKIEISKKIIDLLGDAKS